MAKMGKREKNLFEKIAALTGQDVDSLVKVSKSANLYSPDETIFEAQSVLNFYKCRVNLERLKDETDLEFNSRYNAWKIKKCGHCNEDFAYSYSYDGVNFCSLDCLDAELKQIGLKVTPGRDLKKRWGIYHPAIVPSPALEGLRSLFPDAEGLKSSPS